MDQHSLKIKKIDLAYLAGFFDGEGTVGVYMDKYATKTMGIRQIPVLQTKIYNTREDVLLYIKDMFSGSVSYNSKGKRICYQWGTSSRKSVVFLKAILPYLIVKKEQAEISIYLYENYNNLSQKEIQDSINTISSLKKRSYKNGMLTAPYRQESFNAYLAGFLDAEGSIYSVSYLRSDNGKTRINTFVKLSNSILPFSEYLVKTYGGKIEENSHCQQRTKVCYSWVLSGSPCIVFLDDILPYMRLKNDRAKLLKDFWCNSRTRSSNELRRRIAIKKEMSELNS